MALIAIVLSILLLLAYGFLFLRPRFRLLAACIVSASFFLLYLTMAIAVPQSEVINRLSIIMLGPTGVGAIVLGICHVVFERGSAGTMTGARRAPRPRHDATNGNDRPPREVGP